MDQYNQLLPNVPKEHVYILSILLQFFGPSTYVAYICQIHNNNNNKYVLVFLNNTRAAEPGHPYRPMTIIINSVILLITF